MMGDFLYIFLGSENQYELCILPKTRKNKVLGLAPLAAMFFEDIKMMLGSKEVLRFYTLVLLSVLLHLTFQLLSFFFWLD